MRRRTRTGRGSAVAEALVAAALAGAALAAVALVARLAGSFSRTWRATGGRGLATRLAVEVAWPAHRVVLASGVLR
jgi:hypothetical protein